MSDSYRHLVGRIGTEPSVKVVASGKTLAEFRLAVDGEYDPATKKRPVEWYDVTAWEPMHSAVMGYGVGSRVWVAGPVDVYKGATGDRLKVKAREFGLVEKIIPGYTAPAPAATVAKATVGSASKPAPTAAPEGVTLDEDGEW